MSKYLFLTFVFGLATLTASCQSANENNNKVETEALEIIKPVQTESENGLSKAYFASGCFWCVEAIYESVNGVSEAISGYAGGHTENPNYQDSNTGTTGHAEANEIYYNPDVVSFKTLVTIYFGSQNITQVNGQGPDQGSQYRSIIFYQNDEEKNIIDKKVDSINATLNGKEVAAQVVPFQTFWVGEDYHQNFEQLNPYHPYIQNVSIPRLNKFKRKFPELLKMDH